jgi:hypothetical protein
MLLLHMQIRRYFNKICDNKVYTDIDPTVDFIFPVNKIDRKTGSDL